MTNRNHLEQSWLDEFSFRLKYYMRRRRVDVKEMAALLNVSIFTVYKYINGERMPNLITIVDIARILGMTTDELIAFKPSYYGFYEY